MSFGAITFSSGQGKLERRYWLYMKAAPSWTAEQIVERLLIPSGIVGGVPRQNLSFCGSDSFILGIPIIRGLLCHSYSGKLAQKVERAEEHINDLNRTISEFIDTPNYVAFLERDVTSSHNLLKVRATKVLPARFNFVPGRNS